MSPQQKDNLYTKLWRSGQMVGFCALIWQIESSRVEIITTISNQKQKGEIHEESDKSIHSAMWKRFDEMDNRIYGLQGEKQARN